MIKDEMQMYCTTNKKGAALRQWLFSCTLKRPNGQLVVLVPDFEDCMDVSSIFGLEPDGRDSNCCEDQKRRQWMDAPSNNCYFSPPKFASWFQEIIGELMIVSWFDKKCEIKRILIIIWKHFTSTFLTPFIFTSSSSELTHLWVFTIEHILPFAYSILRLSTRRSSSVHFRDWSAAGFIRGLCAGSSGRAIVVVIVVVIRCATTVLCLE